MHPLGIPFFRPMAKRVDGVHRARGERNGRTLELDQVLLFRIEAGLVQGVLALPSDPAEFDRFWA